jgi:hypothetical protein
MFSQRTDFYPHRRNNDGSFDSICLNCFVTLANARTEPELWNTTTGTFVRPGLSRSELSPEGCWKERPSQREFSELRHQQKGCGQTFLARRGFIRWAV